ncbi:MAG: hypothetical protein ACTSQI_01245 [Candidatus Helarchaeota archaeon]
MGAGRTFVGILFCIGTVALIIVFVTLGMSAEDVLGSFDTALVQGIFLIAVHPYTFLITGTWSLLAALAAGAFIGGLIAKGAKSGLAVGSISFGLLLLLQISVAFFFDFNALSVWYALITITGGNAILDFVIGAGVMLACGAIGGALTGGGD